MDILEKVKKNLQITGHFQDETIQGYIDEVRQFMIDGGVSEQITYSERAIGVITRGVADIWNYGTGNTALSEYFMQRMIQLALDSGGRNDA